MKREHQDHYSHADLSGERMRSALLQPIGYVVQWGQHACVYVQEDSLTKYRGMV